MVECTGYGDIRCDKKLSVVWKVLLEVVANRDSILEFGNVCEMKPDLEVRFQLP